MICQQHRVSVPAVFHRVFGQLRGPEGVVGSAGNLIAVGVRQHIVHRLNGLAENGEGGAETGMGVDNGPAVGFMPVELRVHVPLTGGFSLSVHYVGFQVHDHDVFRLGLHVPDTRGLDRHQAQLRIIDALVSAGSGAEP